MSGGLRRSLVALLLLAASGSTLLATHTPAAAAGAKKDPLADRFGGQIFFLDRAPPQIIGDPGWFSAHRITKKDETSENKWPLHMMIFMKRPLDVQKIDLMVYKFDKKGVTSEFVEKREQFPNQDDARSFYFAVSFKKEGYYEPNLKYQIKAVVPGVGPVAEGTIELDGKEEKIGGGPIDFTAGRDLSGPKEEKATAPFDEGATTEALKKIIYEDCKTTASAGGLAKINLKFAAKDGKVLDAAFAKDPPAPYSDQTQTCIVRRFQRARTKPFTGNDQLFTYTVALDVPNPNGGDTTAAPSGDTGAKSTKTATELTSDLPPESDPTKDAQVKKGGGCAGCSIPDPNAPALPAGLLLGLSAVLVARRRRA